MAIQQQRSNVTPLDVEQRSHRELDIDPTSIPPHQRERERERERVFVFAGFVLVFLFVFLRFVYLRLRGSSTRGEGALKHAAAYIAALHGVPCMLFTGSREAAFHFGAVIYSRVTWGQSRPRRLLPNIVPASPHTTEPESAACQTGVPRITALHAFHTWCQC